MDFKEGYEAQLLLTWRTGMGGGVYCPLPLRRQPVPVPPGVGADFERVCLSGVCQSVWMLQ